MNRHRTNLAPEKPETEKHARIAARAYAIWEQGGRQEGCALEHWIRAEREIGTEDTYASQLAFGHTADAGADAPSSILSR